MTLPRESALILADVVEATLPELAKQLREKARLFKTVVITVT